LVVWARDPVLIAVPPEPIEPGAVFEPADVGETAALVEEPTAAVDDVAGEPIAELLDALWAEDECAEPPHALIDRKTGSIPRSATRRLTFLA
jgi:hypothetical protein